jgi:HSP20 family protein
MRNLWGSGKKVPSLGDLPLLVGSAGGGLLGVSGISRRGVSMTSLVPRSTFPDLFRMLESGWPFGDHHAVRIEDYRDNGNYVLRAELPGMDPKHDITITVAGNELSITAERTVDEHDKTHSEFCYGSFARTVRLPAGVEPEKVTARYDAGILEVTLPVEPPAESRTIPVHVGKKA